MAKTVLGLVTSELKLGSFQHLLIVEYRKWIKIKTEFWDWVHSLSASSQLAGLRASACASRGSGRSSVLKLVTDETELMRRVCAVLRRVTPKPFIDKKVRNCLWDLPLFHCLGKALEHRPVLSEMSCSVEKLCGFHWKCSWSPSVNDDDNLKSLFRTSLAVNS